MFYVNFIFDDSSRLSWFVEASDERSAVNAILNTTKMTKNPKFVVFEKPNVIATNDDIDLLTKFESWGGEYDNVFSVENKLSQIIEIDGIKVHLGSLANLSEMVNFVDDSE